jgi:hypothetical protein
MTIDLLILCRGLTKTWVLIYTKDDMDVGVAWFMPKSV